ncbi:hypothetical protein [Zoogloea sp.]|uniref:hypothetical protein n=1 Tax=Zoogloea sp. TaxID=49181 RepID=UPI0025F6A8EC|nr:hypothetical protein [Zoogloea sp.]
MITVSKNMLFIQRNVTFDSVGRLRSVGMIAAACAALLSGCATLGGANAPEDEVRERAQARWTAIVTGKWEKAYSYATPGYRQAVDVRGFTGRSAPAAKLKSAEVVNVKCKDATCDVIMRIGFAPLQRGYPETTTDLEERWILEEGEWWRYERF